MYIHGHFYNKHDERIEVHIVTKGDRSEERVIGEEADGLFFTDDPIELTSEANNTTDHLLCQQAAVRLLTRNFIPEFFCASARDAVINIYRDGVCLFAGFIEPQTYSQGFNEDLDEIELSCIDALTALEYGKYRNVGAEGVIYGMVKSDADQRSFIDILREVMDGVTAELDILNGEPTPYYYDGSKAVDDAAANRHSVFGQLSVNELLFLGGEEDDVWSQSDVIREMLQYLNLHMVQDGLGFYIFSWETVKGMDSIYWRNLTDGARMTQKRHSEDIRNEIVADAETQISVGEVYNKIVLTCDVESVESMIESPLEDDSLHSPYKSYEMYMREYSKEGKGYDNCKVFQDMLFETNVVSNGAVVTDWYVQLKQNRNWKFNIKDDGDAYLNMHEHQSDVPRLMRKTIGASVMSFAKHEKVLDGMDNSVQPKLDFTNYMVISVNGNENDSETGCRPSDEELLASCPCAEYVGPVGGGVLSPSDENTVNYIVLSGSLMLNPIMKTNGRYSKLCNPASTLFYQYYLYGALGDKTVPSRNNKNGRYYTQRWYPSEDYYLVSPPTEPDEEGVVPFTGTGPEQYEFKYSAIGNGSDTISKVGVLSCMLIIGDKCVVETGTSGKVTDFEWKEYKPMDQCASEDEYYQQSFTIGFDPKRDDKLIGKEYDLQNNVSIGMGIDAEGIAIPITKDDNISGRVQFKILGPVNVMWDVITRRHKTWFRKTKWTKTSIPLLAHVSSIFLKEFEMKIYSDNGRMNNTGDNDIIYMSDTKEGFVNAKDDIEFRIHSALTTEENLSLGVTDTVKMSTPINMQTKRGVLTLYDYNRGEEAKAEQLYVDSYYREYHQPRITMVQNLVDVGGVADMFAHYRHPALNKTFFVQSMGRNLEEGTAEMTLKEIEQ